MSVRRPHAFTPPPKALPWQNRTYIVFQCRVYNFFDPKITFEAYCNDCIGTLPSPWSKSEICESLSFLTANHSFHTILSSQGLSANLNFSTSRSRIFQIGKYSTVTVSVILQAKQDDELWGLTSFTSRLCTYAQVCLPWPLLLNYLDLSPPSRSTLHGHLSRPTYYSQISHLRSTHVAQHVLSSEEQHPTPKIKTRRADFLEER